MLSVVPSIADVLVEVTFDLFDIIIVIFEHIRNKDWPTVRYLLLLYVMLCLLILLSVVVSVLPVIAVGSVVIIAVAMLFLIFWKLDLLFNVTSLFLILNCVDLLSEFIDVTFLMLIWYIGILLEAFVSHRPPFVLFVDAASRILLFLWY